MASVLELGVSTGKWDAGLRKAKSALDNFIQANGGLTQALDKESAKMSKFVQMMGGMESKAKTAKGQMNDYKSTLEQLTMQYNRLTAAQKKTIGQDYLQAIDQIKQKYHQVNQEVKDFNNSLNSGNTEAPSAGGMFSGDAMAVFKGNLMTKAAMMAGELAINLGDAVKQGVELARQGEGIRLAFERVGDETLLDGLRKATHGTVTDLELMKQAVKFSDFKLPLEQMGTLLAFAQQKAKDTGQSVDYMVDSIVTGLGRQSLLILDNLGLSAAEIKDKMKETGDMTTAVAEIIREQMGKAGDYVETAADRAKKAEVAVQNKLEELGRTFQPLSEAGGEMWNQLKVDALDFLQWGVTPVIKSLEYLGLLKKQYLDNNTSGATTGSNGMQEAIDKATQGKVLGTYTETTQNGKVVKAERDGVTLFDLTKGGSGNKKSTTPTYAAGSIAAQQAEVQRLTKLWNDAGEGVRDQYLMPIIEAERKLKDMKNEQSLLKEQVQGKLLENKGTQTSGIGTLTDYRSITFEGFGDKTNKKIQDTIANVEQLKIANEQAAKAFNMGANAASALASALAGIDDPGAKAAGTVLQAIASITLGFASASAQASSMGPYGWIAYVAAGAAALAQTISMVHSLTGLAEGGIVPGNTYSGDQINGGGAMVNAGELVLNRAQQGNIASQLQDGGGSNPRPSYISGEQIYLAMNRYMQRTGRGELATWK